MINGKRSFINLPYKCRSEDFNRKRRPRELQEYVNITLHNVNVILLDMAKYGIPVTTENLRDYFKTGGFKPYRITDLFTEYLNIIRKRVGTDLSMSAYRKYEKVSTLFLSHTNPENELTTVTPSIIQDFYILLQKNYSTATAASYIAKLKTMIQFGIDNDHIHINPFQGLKVHREKKPIDFLTPTEIEMLRTLHIENQSLSQVRDAFLLQTYTGLSYIDLEHLQTEDIRQENGVNYIRKKRIKTGVEYISVILPEGMEILKRHNYKLKIISNQKMNVYLKQIMALAGLNHNLTTHLGRKTYGHILLNKGLRLETVAKSLGHSSTRTTQRYYAELTQTTVLEEIRQHI